MLFPIHGRFRTPRNGFLWSDVLGRSPKTKVVEGGVGRWQPLLAGIVNMPTEIAKLDTDDGQDGIERFLAKWGLPIIPDETKACSMTLADLRELSRHMREAVAHSMAGSRAGLSKVVRDHAFVAPRICYDEDSGLPAYIEARDPASFAWLQLGQQRGGEYRSCGWCGTYFVVAGEAGHRRSRQFCSDRCRVAANRAKNR